MNFTDPYENILFKNVIYTRENIPITETEEAFNEIFIQGCSCKNICSMESNCVCIIKYGINYNISNNYSATITHEELHTKYVLNENKMNNGIFECHANCNCKHDTCGNKLIQYGPRNHLQVRISNEKGHGLFTKQKILEGNFICEYAGEVITKYEAEKRFKHNKNHNLMNYIICLREYFGNNFTVTYIDPSYFGNIGRYLNHSCNPNCILIPVRTNCLIPKLGIFAKMDIQENSELTFDYGEGSNIAAGDSDLDLKECLCGEENCRKWLPYTII